VHVSWHAELWCSEVSGTTGGPNTIGSSAVLQTRVCLQQHYTYASYVTLSLSCYYLSHS
jgi:hypothetical protein